MRLGWLCGTGPALAGIVREVRAFALSRDGENRVLRSNARYGPVPLTPVCGWGWCVFVGEGLMEDWDLGSEGAFRGGSAGLGLRSRGSFGVREILLLFYRAAGIETN